MTDYNPLMKIIYISLILFYLVTNCCNIQAEEDAVIPPATPQQQSPEQGCVVFADTSFNMRGFFKPSKSSSEEGAVQKYLHTELRNFVSENKLYPLFWSTFSNEIPTPVQLNENIGTYFSYKSDKDVKDFFRHIHSDLAGLFMSPEFGKHSVSIIITDGIQSTEDGFDIGGMINALESRISEANEGLHLYLFGFEADFDGFVLPLHSHESPFWHKGKRPFYIWLVTHDAELKRDMEKRISGFTDDFRSVGLTDISLPVAHVSLDSSSQNRSKQKNYLYIERPDGVVDLKLSGISTGTIQIPLTIESDSSVTNDGYYRLKLQLESSVEWAETTESEGKWYISLNCDRVPSSGFFGGGSRNEIIIKTIAIPDKDKWWWREWSTENITTSTTRVDADKTLYLNRIGKQLLEPNYNAPHDIESVTFRIKK